MAFSFIMNDPTTPDLIIQVPMLSPLPQPPFRVEGYVGENSTIGSLEHQACCCAYNLTSCLSYANQFLEKPITQWAAVGNLLVLPRAGQQINAFYDRKSLRFFWAHDPVSKSTCWTSNSHDVVCHEIGHAILDILRPALYQVVAFEVWAFHESFGDIHAILNALKHPEVIDYVLKEVNNDLRKSNTVSRLAEEMAKTIFDLGGGRQHYSALALRDAVNSFKYVEPETLPNRGFDDQITREPHSFSRIFTAAFYDILCGIYEDKAKTMSPKDAVASARDIMAKYIFGAIPMMAAGVRFYNNAARAMLVIDKTYNYQYNLLMNSVFINRGILREQVKPMVDLGWDLYVPVDGDQIFTHSEVKVVLNKNTQTLSLPHFMLNVEMPNDSYLEFDKNGDCVSTISADGAELVEHASNCVEFLQANNLISPASSTPFEIDPDGNLIRSHISCFLSI